MCVCVFVCVCVCVCKREREREKIRTETKNMCLMNLVGLCNDIHCTIILSYVFIGLHT